MLNLGSTYLIVKDIKKSVMFYWGDAKNTYSAALAKSLGFKMKSEEIVVGTYLNE